jgi:hypothetical protein
VEQLAGTLARDGRQERPINAWVIEYTQKRPAYRRPASFAKLPFSLPAPGGNVYVDRGAWHGGRHVCRRTEVHAAAALAGTELTSKEG